MLDVLNHLQEPINQLIVFGVVLLFWGLGYFVRLLSGMKRVRKQLKKWNWAQFWDGVLDRTLWVVAGAAAIVACDMAKWLTPHMGITLSEEVKDVISAAAVITIPFVCGLNDLYRGIVNLKNNTGWDKNLKSLGMSEADIDNTDLDTIAEDTKKFLVDLYTAVNTRHDDENIVEGEVINHPAEMGAIPYYKVNVATPEAFYNGVIGRGFDEGYGKQCVAGFKEFMYSLCGRYVAAGGGAKNYANASVRGNVCALGFEWHDGAAGLQDGDWGIWTVGENGHVAMYYQGKWLGQNQGASNPNAGNAFNLMTLSTNGLAGYFRPNIYKKVVVNNTPAPAPIVETPKTNNEQVIAYTYVKGDNFGSVITKLGLKTQHGLWGPDGDVAYYKQQLGITGNIPIGTTLNFKKRTN